MKGNRRYEYMYGNIGMCAPIHVNTEKWQNHIFHLLSTSTLRKRAKKQSTHKEEYRTNKPTISDAMNLDLDDPEPKQHDLADRRVTIRAGVEGTGIINLLLACVLIEAPLSDLFLATITISNLILSPQEGADLYLHIWQVPHDDKQCAEPSKNKRCAYRLLECQIEHV